MADLLTHPDSNGIPNGRWQRPVWFAFAAVLGILVLFHETFWSMVVIWWSSNTFSHGFFVLPISAWLIWQQRRRLVLLEPRPQFRILGLILPVGCAWLLAHLAEAQVPAQLAVISLLILSVWCLLGTAVVRVLLFPLGFLFFAVPLVPLEDALIRPMMDFTADVSVRLLRLTGVAVYQHGTYFSLSSGDWEVARACSGIRYLLACVSLGCLYAYLAYRSLLRRLLFIGFSMVMPVIANIVRVLIIVMLGHLSDMKLAVGTDHLLYGWVFFVLVITVMFLIGSIWREPPDEVPEGKNHTDDQPPAELNLNARKHFAGACAATLLAVAIWPGFAFAIDQIQVQIQVVNDPGELQVPAGTGGWRIDTGQAWVWWPRVAQVDGEFYKFYRKDNRTVSLYVGQLQDQHAGGRQIDYENVVVVRDRTNWQSNRRPSSRTVNLGDRNLRVIQSTTKTPGRRMQGWHKLLIWHWYRLGDSDTSSPYAARLLDLWSRLSGRRRDKVLLVLATPYDGDLEAAARVLRSFAEDMLPEIENSLDRPVSRG